MVSPSSAKKNCFVIWKILVCQYTVDWGEEGAVGKKEGALFANNFYLTAKFAEKRKGGRKGEVYCAAMFFAFTLRVHGVLRVYITCNSKDALRFCFFAFAYYLTAKSAKKARRRRKVYCTATIFAFPAFSAFKPPALAMIKYFKILLLNSLLPIHPCLLIYSD
jgi:hypothetical protein